MSEVADGKDGRKEHMVHMSTPCCYDNPVTKQFSIHGDGTLKGVYVAVPEGWRMPPVQMIKVQLPDGAVGYHFPNWDISKIRQMGFTESVNEQLLEFMSGALGQTWEETMKVPSKEWIARKAKEEEGFDVACGVPSAIDDGKTGGFIRLYGSPEQIAALDKRQADRKERQAAFDTMRRNHRRERLFIRPDVKSKRDYYVRYIAGEFGNRLQVWASMAEWEASGYVGAIGIRNRKPDSPYCRYDIPHRLVRTIVNEFLGKGCPVGDMTFNEAAPDTDLILQGEFMRLPGGLQLTYSKVKRQMRIALKEKPEYASGNHAIQILKAVMDTSSYEWCEYLLDAYPDHAIEFSTYRRNLGNIPRRNTLIWEVRKY